MKRVLLVTILILCIAGIASAEIPTKIAIVYNLDGNNPEEAIGTSKELAILKGLEADFLVASEVGETLTDDEKTAITGISYNYNVNSKVGIFAGIGLGVRNFLDIQEIRDKDNVEIDRYVYTGLKYKF